MSDSAATRNVGLVRLDLSEEALPDGEDLREVPEPVLRAQPPEESPAAHGPVDPPAGDPGAGQAAPEAVAGEGMAGAAPGPAEELDEPQAAGSFAVGAAQASENELSPILMPPIRRGRRQAEMPNQVGIEVSDLVLRYPVGAARRGSLKSGLLGLFGHRDANAQIDHVSAIRGVSFKVECGERVGIIGRNGSGKSSLLRVLAGVFPVETGSVQVFGEIGTLLDIGLGFETESTGRENIYNRGFAMGRSRKELRAAEAEIIAQADLGEFIDLPMRTYSSGMFVRLGFAISTQFTPQVLLVDEVFGAGDAVFAKRAKARIRHLTANTGILMLVSHDFAAILDTCTRVIWMDRGQIIADGDPEEIVSHYLSAAASAHEAGKE